MSFIKYTVEDGKLFCRVSEINKIISDEELPLRFVVYPEIGDKILYECELFTNMWANYIEFADIKSRVYTKSGILLKEYRYEDDLKTDNLYEFWDYFCKINKDSIGLVIGAGDGTWGEWTRPVNENKVK